MFKKPKLLSDLFHDTLKESYYFAENKISQDPAENGKGCAVEDLKAAFVKHERETRGQSNGSRQYSGF